MNFIPWTEIKVTGGFWKKWQEIGAENTSKAIYDRFKNTGRIDAMKLEWKEGMANKPHVFWDSDIAKWMEGTAYFLYLKNDKDLREKLETIIDYVIEGQTKDGYFNSAFLTLEPDKCFTDRTNHELYTAGHFIEAAIAHYYSTGNDRFLKAMQKFGDHIEKVFKIDGNGYYKTPGHQELELALVRLWEATGEKRYLELSKYFVDTRGTDKKERVFSVPNGTFPADPPLANQLLYNDTYAQDDAPARELPGAAGHAVRAMYFYTAMADISREYQDEELFIACKRLWDDSVNKKMYITGGVSAERYGEAIGTDYVLPNDYSYAETCASVAMANFSQRMFCLEPDGKYMDMVERQMYNGALVGLSMDGKGFYYDNALQSRPKVNDFFAGINGKPLLPAYKRQEIFECSCCPPNIYRFLAAMGQYFYSVEEPTLYIHQYAQSSGTVTVGGEKIRIIQETEYPWKDTIRITFQMENPVTMTLGVRIPGWCENASVKRNGILEEIEIKNGYFYIDTCFQPDDTIELTLPMEITEIEGNPNIVDAGGRIALKRGPVVYCLEGIDNDFNIFDLILGKVEPEYKTEITSMLDYSLALIKGKGMVHKVGKWDNILYQPVKKELEEVTFTAVPYFSWSNRDVNDMTVWIKYNM